MARTLLVLILLVGAPISATAEEEVDCATLVANPDTTLDDALAAGCSLSAEQIARLMDNPVGELIMLPIQWDGTSIEEPTSGENLEVDAIKLIPTFPVRGDKWSLVNRIAVPWVDLPIERRSAELGLRPDLPLPLAGVTQGPPPFVAGSTSGLGDIVYVGLLTPKEPPSLGQGKLIWAVGPTLVAPTASEDILGQGKWQLGPAVAAGYLGRKWTFGLLAQQWWSVAGDDDRGSVSQLSIQYFWSRRLPRQWSLGAAPTITVDWDESQTNVPLGVGLNKTVVLGKLPARFGLELARYVDRDEDSISPEWAARFSITAVVPSAFLRRKR